MTYGAEAALRDIGGARWCEVDHCPASMCLGPHREVVTDLGTEILAPGQQPVGKPVAPTTGEQPRVTEES
jgi:hypothetical protein